jgi:hypothetical protein
MTVAELKQILEEKLAIVVEHSRDSDGDSTVKVSIYFDEELIAYDKDWMDDSR